MKNCSMTFTENIKILPLKQMLQRLLILLAQVQASYRSENLPNKTQHVFSKTNFNKSIQ